jgi:hypothetical protein
MIEKSNLVLLEPFLPLTTSGAVKPGLIAVFLGEELLAAAFANHIHSYTSHHDLIPLPSSTESFVLIIRACSYCAFTPETKYSVLPFSIFFRF